MAGSKIQRNEEDDQHDMVEDKKVVHRHPSPPQYYPSDDRYAIELDPDTYRPRDLLNLSVKSFWLREDDQLSLRQLHARRAFCSEYERGLPLFDCDVAGGDGGQQQLARQQQCVNSLKRYLDEFFFFDQLRRRLDLTAGIDAVRATGDGAIQADWDGHTQVHAGRCRVRINVGRGGRVFPLLAVAETLVHELAHAYLLVFSDRRCATCRRDRPNTIGLEGDGHGPVFLQLHRVMVTEVRGWHDGLLRPLAAEDCPGRTTASRRARDLAAAAYRGLSRRDKALYNKPRGAGSGRDRSYIRLTAEGRVVVEPDLVAGSLIAEEESERRRLQRAEDDVEALSTMMSRQSLRDVIDKKKVKMAQQAAEKRKA
ncbi:hypothetical protein SLS62_008943 [Diatrype stigma]|uniref:SprT-like domain-containing protein n=1 Tax=Diatrype stigma TaxID=117547 RepID=A0AAN9UH94_9PEZI